MGEMTPLIRQYSGETAASLGASIGGAQAICVAEYAGTVTSVSYVPTRDITGTTTDYRTISLINKGTDGTGATVVATFAFDSNADSGTAQSPTTLAIVAASDDVSDGEVLAASSYASNGTGLSDPGGVMVVEITRKSSD